MTKTIINPLIAVVLLLSSEAFSQEQNDEVISQKQNNPGLGLLLSSNRFKIVREDYPADGVNVGQGWDRFLDRKVAGNCVTGTVYPFVGRGMDLKLERIEDKEHVFNSLAVSASAKMNGGFASGEGSA